LSQTHAEGTLAKADAALRQREAELARLKAAHRALRSELTEVKRGLRTSAEKAEKLHEEGQVGILLVCLCILFSQSTPIQYDPI